MKGIVKRYLGLKGFFGTVMGFFLAVALCGLYGWLGPGSLHDKYMLVLWMIAPVWLIFLVFALLFSSVKKLVFYYGMGNLIAYLLLWYVRNMMQ